MLLLLWLWIEFFYFCLRFVFLYFGICYYSRDWGFALLSLLLLLDDAMISLLFYPLFRCTRATYLLFFVITIILWAFYFLFYYAKVKGSAVDDSNWLAFEVFYAKKLSWWMRLKIFLSARFLFFYFPTSPIKSCREPSSAFLTPS